MGRHAEEDDRRHVSDRVPKRLAVESLADVPDRVVVRDGNRVGVAGLPTTVRRRESVGVVGPHPVAELEHARLAESKPEVRPVHLLLYPEVSGVEETGRSVRGTRDGRVLLHAGELSARGSKTSAVISDV
ncbi:hypothetical protein [Halorussus caseinilyticus]|uniref:Uncharacterized protein n=1 Tax=Halorussus caseinilyticus TaxID=3034025 RepID=A0ABD5WMC6_9EURY